MKAPTALPIALLLMVSAWSQAQHELPSLGDSSASILSPDQQRRLGNEFIRELRREETVLDDAEVDDYIQSLGARLERYAGFAGRMDFFVIDNPSINAFAVPGGFIGLNSGIILNAGSESEVASVLAHEVIHLTQNHTLRSIEAQGRAAVPSLLGMLAAIALAAASPEAGQAALMGVTAAQEQFAINFTRGNEQEADRLGIRLLYEAGFDPQAMPRFFERLQLVNRYNDPKYVPEYLRTHPVTPARIAESTDRARRLPAVRSESPMAFHLIAAKLRVLTAGTPVEAVQFFEAMLRNRQYDIEAVARYGYALALTAIGDYAAGRDELVTLLREDSNRVQYYVAAGELEARAGNYAEAARLYQRGYEIDPGYRAAFYGYARALVNAGQPLEARTALRRYDISDDEDPVYFEILADAERNTGNPGDARIAMSEFYYRSGELQLAARELDLAQELPNLSNYQLQRIRARLVEIQSEVARVRAALDDF